MLEGGLAGEVGDEGDKVDPTGDLESIGLREDFERFDFHIPFIVRDAEEELKAPSLDPMGLPAGRYPFELLKKAVGSGDRFVSQDAQTGTQYGDYRVDGGVMTATGYNDYLSRMTTRISEALGSSLTKSAKHYSEASRYPMLQAYRPMLTGWLDTYIRRRLFRQAIDPFQEENWRVLLIDDVAHAIAGTFATALTELAENQQVQGAEVIYRRLSEVKVISVRTSSAVDVDKCIYPKLPVPKRAGGLERLLIEWADDDAQIEALTKIHEYRHDFLHRPYLRVDGMPAYYSPDFLVRTADKVFIVETKAQSALSDENVHRKQRAAIGWCELINTLPAGQRDNREWYYVLLGESTAREWKTKNARVSELMEFARLRRAEGPAQERLI